VYEYGNPSQDGSVKSEGVVDVDGEVKEQQDEGLVISRWARTYQTLSLPGEKGGAMAEISAE
jgi:hypothetical protein